SLCPQITAKSQSLKTTQMRMSPIIQIAHIIKIWYDDVHYEDNSISTLMQSLPSHMAAKDTENRTKTVSEMQITVLEQAASETAMRTGRPPILKKCKWCKRLISARQRHVHRCPENPADAMRIRRGEVIGIFMKLISAATNECIHFTHSLSNGRGIIHHQGRNWRARALAWNMMYPDDPVPRGVLIRQICGIKTCVNPRHLYLETKWLAHDTGMGILKSMIVLKTKKCIHWPYNVTKDGYGHIKFRRKNYGAHVMAWMLTRDEPIPNGLCICHKCDVRNCINPKHLFIGTDDDNRRDMISKNRHVFGERHPSAKLTAKQVIEIRNSDR